MSTSGFGGRCFGFAGPRSNRVLRVSMWQFVPGPAIQDAPRALLAHPDERRYRPFVSDPVGLLRVPVAPLLEMEGNASPHALIAEPAEPVRMGGSSSTPALSPCNDPVQPVDVIRQIHRAKERLAAQEPIPARDIQQATDPSVGEVLILDRRSQPHVARPCTSPRRKSTGEMRPLGQQQPIEVGCTPYESPEPVTEPVQAMVPLEHVRHRRAEHAHATAGQGRVPIPTKRLIPVVVAELPARSVCTPDAVACTLCPDFGVAVSARRGNPCATPPRVECMLRPLDC